MRILIQIGEDEQAFDFDLFEISIGSSPNCDIHLAYEGVGEKHLRIFEKNKEFFVEDLNSGFSTYVNDEVIKPHSVCPFNSFFPVEVGGIVISLGNEIPPQEVQLEELPGLEVVSEKLEVPPIPEDEPIVAKETEAQVDENVVKEISQKFEQEHAEEREKFKPDLFSNKGTTEFKIDQTALKQKKKKKKKISSKVGTRKRKVKRRKKKQPHLDVKSNVQRFGLGTVAAMGALLFIAGFIFYKQHYSKFVTKKVVVKPVIKMDDFRIAGSPLKYVSANQNKIVKKLNEGGCEPKGAAGICEFLGGADLYFKPENIFVEGDVLHIYLSENTLRTFEKLLAYKGDEISLVHAEIETNYKGLFTVEEFENNGQKAPISSYEITTEEYRYNMLMMGKFFSQEFLNLLQENGISKVVCLSLTEVDKLVSLNSSIELETNSLEFHLTKLDDILLKIKMLYNSNLIYQVDQLFKPILKVNNEDYNPKDVNKFVQGNQVAEYRKYFELPKCKEAEVGDICSELGEFLTNEQEGPTIQEGTLILTLGEEKVTEIMKKRYGEPYDDTQKDSLIGAYRKVNRMRGYEFRDFKLSGFLENRLTLKEWRTNAFLSVFLSPSVLNTVESYDQIKKVLIIGTIGGGITTVMEFPKEAFKDLNAGTLEDDKKFFWKSKLDTFTKLIKGKATFTVGF